MSFCKQKFWLENPTDLFCNFQLIPLVNMKLSEQMNSLTRLVFIISFILLPINTKMSITFIILSLLFIIILYYIQKRTMEKYQVENFKYNSVTPQNIKRLCSPSFTHQPKGKSDIRRTDDSNRFFNDEVHVNPNDPNYKSANQALAGSANPKTSIPPVVTAPPMALDFWRDTNLTNHSHINKESQMDTYLSGYEVSNYENGYPNDLEQNNGTVTEDYEDLSGNFMFEGISDKYRSVRKPSPPPQQQIQSPVPSVTIPYMMCKNPGNVKEGYYEQKKLLSHPNNAPNQISSISSEFINEQPVSEGFEYPYLKEDYMVKNNESGWVNTTCGYNPDQIKSSNLPSNLNAGNCEKSEVMKEYNKNLFTQNIQPDIYTRNEVIEPINTNIGISFTQQFEPTTSSRSDGKGLTYVEHDPRIFNPKQQSRELPMGITEADVYDPRFSGYGTSYRAYTEDVTGQTRFYYDDVNSIRMPNYISRSNIDFANYADSYGPLTNKNRYGNVNTNNIKALAQESFLISSLQQRTELQERLMRKRNAELWQLRKYPKHTGGQRGAGSIGCAPYPIR